MIRLSKMKSQKDKILVFTDGACSGNPGPGGWGAILAFPGGEVIEMGGGLPSTTNNQMEMTAAVEAFKAIPFDQTPIQIFTDSSYLVQGITKWIEGWTKNQWKGAQGQEIANKDLWQMLLMQVSERQIQWQHIAGHAGIPANERADQIAVAYSRGEKPPLYRGSLASYRISLETHADKAYSPSKSSKKQHPYSYLSLVGNHPMRHTSWAECEQRVKGQSNARYKKAMSPMEETRILESWGFEPKDLLVKK